MMNFKKIKSRIQLLWHSLFRGMASADTIINSPTGSANSVEIVQQIRGGGGVFDDLLQQKETQRVIETRDKYYRVLKEADKLDTSGIKIIGEDDDGLVFSIPEEGLRKKSKTDFMKHPPVFNDGNFSLRTIQDNKQIQKSSNFNIDLKEALNPSLTNYDTTLNIERDDFLPRFQLEKYTKRMVVRNNGNRAYVDLYLPTEASQFGKIDAILIANLNQIWKGEQKNSDLTDFKEIWWYSDKAWNSEDICLFKYDDIKFIGINVFNGSFVLTFDCNIVNDGTDLTEKYRTKDLDYKYETEAPKSNSVDIFALSRRNKRIEEKAAKSEMDLSNMGNTTLKLS